MGWTKKQLLEAAFDEIGLASYVYDLSPDQLQSALRKMDAMVANWQTNGIYLSYPTYTNPDDSLLNEDSNVPDFAVAPIYLNYACRLANSYGRPISNQLEKQAEEAFNGMLNKLGMVYWEIQLPATLPRGQGTKPWRNFNNPFITPAPEPIFTGPDAILGIPPVQYPNENGQF